MYLKKINAVNFKGFEDITVEFSEGMNLIIGDNGVGKTSLLDAIRVNLSAIFALTSNINYFNRNNKNILRQMFSVEGDTTYSLKYVFPLKITSELEWDNGQTDTLETARVGEVAALGVEKYAACKHIEDMLNDSKSKLPLLCFQSFNRDWRLNNQSNNNQITINTGLTMRTDGYQNCFSGNQIEDIIQKWCIKMTMIEFQEQKSVNEFKLFKNSVSLFMKTIMDIPENISVDYSIKSNSLEISFGNKKEPIYNLSTGYRAILSLVMELSYRGAVLNPAMQDFFDLTGVVLIDEIDAHLHPKWQWDILAALKKVFPKVQFIVATHSPIVISSAKDARIIKLIDLKTADVIENAYGYTTDDVLELRQGSFSRPQKIIELKKELEKYIDSGDLNKAESIVKQVKEDYGDNSSIYKEFENFLTVNRWLEEDE